MADLSVLTSLLDFFALAVSLWLGIYVVTRGPRSRVAWLAALTLWAATAWPAAPVLHVRGTSRVEARAVPVANADRADVELRGALLDDTSRPIQGAMLEVELPERPFMYFEERDGDFLAEAARRRVMNA